MLKFNRLSLGKVTVKRFCFMLLTSGAIRPALGAGPHTAGELCFQMESALITFLTALFGCF